MKNIHLLPTYKPSGLSILNSGKLNIGAEFITSSNAIAQHIYITSDEEIKDGDWFLTDDKRVEKCAPDWRAREWHEKIILTTDQDLIADGVQAVDNEFLEWFVKNPSCEKVNLDTFSMGNKILYNVIYSKEKTKQETLEEAAEKYADHQLTGMVDKTSKFECINDFIAGAKWQAGRMYSEDEVRELLGMQRGNSYVAVLNKTRNVDMASLASSAPEPMGKDGWVKKLIK